MGGQFHGCLTSSPAFPVHRRLGWSSLPKASGAGPPLGIPPMPICPRGGLSSLLPLCANLAESLAWEPSIRSAVFICSKKGVSHCEKENPGFGGLHTEK